MSTAGKVRVVGRSKRVPVETAVFGRRVVTAHGVFGAVPRHVILYNSRFDRRDEEAIQEGRRLSSDLGLDLEVVDLSRTSRFKRLALAFLGDGSPTTIIHAPSLGMPGLVAASSDEACNCAECNPSSSIP